MSKKKTRSEIREIAFCFLFQLCVQQDDPVAQEKYFLENYDLDEEETEFFRHLVHGVQAHLDELDQTISPHLRKWKLSRLPLVDLSILRLAVFEAKLTEDTPVNVAISEAVLLAKKYSDDDARSYINAVLGNIAKTIESPDDLDADRSDESDVDEGGAV